MGKQMATADANIINRTPELEERISDVEDITEVIDLFIKENVKSNKFLTQSTQKI